MTELWIVQPYVPAYRIPFFERLGEALSRSGIDIKVVAGVPGRIQARRGDAVAPPWLTRANPLVVSAFGRSLTLTRTRAHWRSADAVIVPHMGSSVDALSALSRKAQLRVGVWGHIASYTGPSHPVDRMIEKWQLRRSDQVFAYTPGGADYARSVGVPDQRITTVMNAIDTDELKASLDRVSPFDEDEYRTRLGLQHRRIFSYIGGLDESKRIDYLIGVLDELCLIDPDIHLLVAGRGESENLLADAERRGQVTMLGHVSGREKALTLRVSEALVCPGRVGLVAVDALVANVPVVTAAGSLHAPEIEYLEEGSSLFTISGGPKEFARSLAKPRGSRDGRERSYPTLDAMVQNFSRGVLRMMD